MIYKKKEIEDIDVRCYLFSVKILSPQTGAHVWPLHALGNVRAFWLVQICYDKEFRPVAGSDYLKVLSRDLNCKKSLV